jgi:hypothetical protein
MRDIAFILYNTPEYSEKVQVVIKEETLWMTQKAMSELFGVQVPAISKHLKNIFESGELQEEVVVSKMEITTPHGAIADKTQTNETAFYNLDAIISVGYRVNSVQATRFRQWATKVLNEYIRKGFVLDDDRLKQVAADGKRRETDVADLEGSRLGRKINRKRRFGAFFVRIICVYQKKTVILQRIMIEKAIIKHQKCC